MEFTGRRRRKRRRHSSRRQRSRHRSSRRRRHRQRRLHRGPLDHCGLRPPRTAPAGLRRLASRSRKASLPPIRRSCRWERGSGSRALRGTTERTGCSTRALPYDNGVWTSTCRIAPKRGNSAADPFALPLFRRGGEAPRHDASPKSASNHLERDQRDGSSS